jgi:hypothetical protein
VSQIENRWLPPSPHREKVEEAVAHGMAHIVERGHNTPPLLVFEDGGAIELPRARYQMTRRGMALVASDAPATKGATRFYDVCGSVDEIKGRLAEADSVEEIDSAYLAALVEDIRYMLGRMARRSDQYRAFLLEVRAAVDGMLALAQPDGASAEARIEALADSLADADGLSDQSRETIYGAAEHVRDLANELEGYLAAGKETAMRVGALQADIQGGRVWQPRVKDEASTA